MISQGFPLWAVCDRDVYLVVGWDEARPVVVAIDGSPEDADAFPWDTPRHGQITYTTTDPRNLPTNPADDLRQRLTALASDLEYNGERACAQTIRQELDK